MSPARQLFPSDATPINSPKKRQPTKISSTPINLERERERDERTHERDERAQLSESDSKVKHHQSHDSPVKHHSRIMTKNQPTRARTIHHSMLFNLFDFHFISFSFRLKF